MRIFNLITIIFGFIYLLNSSAARAAITMTCVLTYYNEQNIPVDRQESSRIYGAPGSNVLNFRDEQNIYRAEYETLTKATLMVDDTNGVEKFSFTGWIQEGTVFRVDLPTSDMTRAGVPVSKAILACIKR
jgi:hypothetical protein